MAKIIALHESESLSLPLADGATLRVTVFRESPRVALTVHGPDGGNAGGVILGAEHARLVGSWLQKLADEAGVERPVRPRARRAH